jgi:dihydrofolate reductase
MMISVFVGASLDGFIARPNGDLDFLPPGGGEPHGYDEFIATVDGGITIQGFLRAGLIQRLTITRVPVLIGDGVPLFGSLPRDIRLRHIATRHYPSGLVSSEYHIAA